MSQNEHSSEHDAKIAVGVWEGTAVSELSEEDLKAIGGGGTEVCITGQGFSSCKVDA